MEGPRDPKQSQLVPAPSRHPTNSSGPSTSLHAAVHARSPLSWVVKAFVRLVLSSLVGLLITVSVFVIMYRKPILYILFGSDKPATLTEINTERNRSSSGQGTTSGFDYRRRQVLRNRFVDLDGTEADMTTEVRLEEFKLVSKPSPKIKSCLRNGSAFAAATATFVDSDAATDSDASSATEGGLSRGKRSKRVRLVDSEDKEALQALREYWATPGVHGGFGFAGSGIGGFRRTREIYMKGQAGKSERPPSSSKGTSGRLSTPGGKSDIACDRDTRPCATPSPVVTTAKPDLGKRSSSPAGSPRPDSDRVPSPSPLRASSPPLSNGFSAGIIPRSSSPHPSARAGRAGTKGDRPGRKRATLASPAPSQQATKSENDIVLPRWVKPKASIGRKGLMGNSEPQHEQSHDEDDGFETTSDTSGASTPTGVGEVLSPFTQIEVKCFARPHEGSPLAQNHKPLPAAL